MVGVDQVRSNTEVFQGVSLGGEILLLRGHACVSDPDLFIAERCLSADPEVTHDFGSVPLPGTRPKPRTQPISLTPQTRLMQERVGL